MVHPDRKHHKNPFAEQKRTTVRIGDVGLYILPLLSATSPIHQIFRIGVVLRDGAYCRCDFWFNNTSAGIADVEEAHEVEMVRQKFVLIRPKTILNADLGIHRHVIPRKELETLVGMNCGQYR